MTAYEIVGSHGPFRGSAGVYFDLYQIVQASAFGVLGSLALAVMVEQVWPDIRPDTPPAPATD